MPSFKITTKKEQNTRQPSLIRHLVLRNPAYRVIADLVTLDPQVICIKKAVGSATKRIEKGRHFFQPYMGLSDFAATLKFTDLDNPPLSQPIEEYLGQFPHYANYDPYDGKDQDPGLMCRPNQVGNIAASLHRRSTVYFDAHIIKGEIKIPPIPISQDRQLVKVAA